jgi:hypothetical protein
VISLEARGLAGTRARLDTGAREFPGVGERAVRRISILMRKKLVDRMSARGAQHPFWGRQAPWGIAYLGARSGQSRARLSPGGVVFKHGNEFRSAVGSPDRHVAFLEKGGTIMGRQFLRIPTRASQTPGGSDRNAGRSIRAIPGAFLLRLRTGSLWAARVVGGKSGVRAAAGAGATRFGPRSGSKLEFLYLLRRSVRLRGRGIFKLTAGEVNDAAPALAQIEVSRFVKQVNG